MNEAAIDLEAFQSHVRRLLESQAPAALRGKAGDPRAHVWGGRNPAFHFAESKEWLALAVEHGWTAPAWPREYGGAGLGAAQVRLLEQEVARLELPPPLVGFGLTMIGPTLLQYASEELKREHLPKIARGEIRWCQGYSEPNAGSDLASLQASAIRDGNHLIVNGQKTWTSYGDLSDWMFMLVRTDAASRKKQAGITFLLVDLASPGVLIRPIRLISGASPFCESFFTDVRVPLRNVVGELHGGWTVAKALLGHERSMLASYFGSGSRELLGADVWDLRANEVVDLAREYVGEAGGAIADPLLRDRIAQLSMDELTFRLALRGAAGGTGGAGGKGGPGAEASLFKIYGTELNQRREELSLKIMGLQALGWEGEGFSAPELARTRDWLRSRGNTIEGGTSEIQLNIIAKMKLALPD